MIKRKELADASSCLNKAADEEPLFVLRAQDVTAPRVIEFWLQLNLLGTDGPGIENGPVVKLPDEKVKEAQACIDAMHRWHTHKMPD